MNSQVYWKDMIFSMFPFAKGREEDVDDDRSKKLMIRYIIRDMFYN